MGTYDFKAGQVKTSKLIGSGSEGNANPSLIIYPSGSATTSETGGVHTNLLSNVGNDTWVFVSGAIGARELSQKASSLFGGDVVISGSSYILDTSKLYFGDNQTNIQSPSSGKLIVTAGSATNDGIKLDSQGGVQLDYADATFGVQIQHNNQEVLKIRSQQSNPVLRIMQDGKDLSFQQYDSVEMLRLTDTKKVLILSGGAQASPHENQYRDINFFVSGSKDNKDVDGGSIALFGGDLAASGTFHALDGIKTYNRINTDQDAGANAHIGSTSVNFNTVHTRNIDVKSGNTLTIKNANTTKLEVGSTEIVSHQTFRPSISNTYDLGTASRKWRNLQLAGNIIANGDVSIDGDLIVANLTVTGSTTFLTSSNTVIKDAIIGLGTSGSVGYAPDGVDVGIIFGQGNISSFQRALFYDDSADQFVLGKANASPASGTFGTVTQSDLLELTTGKVSFAMDSAEYVSGDGTDLTLGSGGDIALTATSQVQIPASIPLTFDGTAADDKISSNGTDLTIAAGGGSIVLDANTDIVLDANGKNIIFKDDNVVKGSIVGNARLTISSSAGNDLVFDSNAGNFRYEKDGTEYFRIKNSSSDVVLQPKVTNKDIIFQEDGGDEVFRIDSSAKDILMAAGNNVSFGASSRFIGDGTDYNSDATAVVIAGSNDIIIGPGSNSQAFVSLGANGQFVVADGAAPTNYLMITGSALGGILSSSVHNKSISIHSNNARESLSIAGAGEAIFNNPGLLGTDTIFTVSGAIDSRGTSVKGTSVFGGDMVVSGTLSVNRGQAGAGSVVTITSDGKVGIGTDTPSYKLEVGGNAAIGEYIFHRADADTFIHFEPDKISFDAGGRNMLDMIENGANTQILILSGGAQASPNEANYSDTNFFVSGSIGSRGSSTKGTAIFGGDLAISGAIHAESNVNIAGDLNVAENIIHSGDSDTKIVFADDAIGFTVGNEQLLTISEAGQDIVKIGDGGDVDFQVRTNGDDNTLYVQGSTDRVGIGTNAPSTILHVKESAPTITIQRESNSNNSTLQFMGQAGAVANVVHMAKTNDLVFSTFDGSDQEEILRLGSHYGSDNRQVILLSGSSVGGTSMQPQKAADINFFVSGAIGSKGTVVKGTSVFGGDTLVSGTLYVAPYNFSAQNEAGGKIAFNNFANTNIQVPTTEMDLLDINSPLLRIGNDISNFEAIPSDAVLFVSGAIGSRDTAVRGTSVFGGDVIISGSMRSKQVRTVNFWINGNLNTGTTITYVSWAGQFSSSQAANNNYLWSRVSCSGSVKSCKIVGDVNNQDVTFGLYKWNISETSAVGHVTSSYSNTSIGVRSKGTAQFIIDELPPTDITGSFSYDPGDYIGFGFTRDGSGGAVGNMSVCIVLEDDTSFIL